MKHKEIKHWPEHLTTDSTKCPYVSSLAKAHSSIGTAGAPPESGHQGKCSLTTRGKTISRLPGGNLAQDTHTFWHHGLG